MRAALGVELVTVCKFLFIGTPRRTRRNNIVSSSFCRSTRSASIRKFTERIRKLSSGSAFLFLLLLSPLPLVETDAFLRHSFANACRVEALFSYGIFRNVVKLVLEICNVPREPLRRFLCNG